MKLFEEKEKKRERNAFTCLKKNVPTTWKTEYCLFCGIQFEALPSGIEAATL